MPAERPAVPTPTWFRTGGGNRPGKWREMKYMLFLLLLEPLLLFAQSDTVPPYRIYSVAQKQEIGLEELIGRLQAEEVIFFGEEHNDSIAHLLELRLLEGLYRQGKKRVMLSMEMFQTDAQLVLDEYRKGLISESNFRKDGKLWGNYEDYRPIVEYARENGIYILAANAPSRYAGLVARKGLKSLDALSRAARSLLAPLPIDTLTGAYYEKFVGMMGGHAGIGSMHLYQAQNLWDATMAWHIARLMKKRRGKKQVLQLTGRFHSDGRLGTVAQLARYSPKLRCTNISVFSDSSVARPPWSQWENLGDYVIITQPALSFNGRE